MTHSLKKSLIATVLLVLFLVVPVAAAGNTVLATHDGNNYSLEDFSIFFLRQLGASGLVTFLEQAVVYEEAKKLGLTPTAEEKAKFISENMSQEIYDGFAELYSAAALDKFVEYTVINDKFRKHLEAKFIAEKNISISDDDAHKFYNQNIGMFQPEERVWMSIISVDTLETANEVLAKLDSGEDFNDLASIYNVDSELRSRAGYVGMMERGQGLPPPIEDAAFALEPGQHSQVIKGTLFHVLYVHDKKPAEKFPFEDVKEDIKLLLKNQHVQRYVDAYLEDLYKRELPRFEIKAKLFKVGEDTQG
ncbi:peptidyl-prolyl cis-trans isomerase [bacterium]|nr:peptidyl-prolyl cis-trans isomerase [bacterium]